MLRCKHCVCGERATCRRETLTTVWPVEVHTPSDLNLPKHRAARSDHFHLFRLSVRSISCWVYKWWGGNKAGFYCPGTADLWGGRGRDVETSTLWELWLPSCVLQAQTNSSDSCSCAESAARFSAIKENIIMFQPLYVQIRAGLPSFRPSCLVLVRRINTTKVFMCLHYVQWETFFYYCNQGYKRRRSGGRWACCDCLIIRYHQSALGDRGRCGRMFGGSVTPFSQHESSDKIEKEKAAETSEYWKSESQESEHLSHSDMSLFFFFYISVLWLFASLDASVHLIGRFVFVSPSDLFLSFNAIFSLSVRVYVCSVVLSVCSLLSQWRRK